MSPETTLFLLSMIRTSRDSLIANQLFLEHQLQMPSQWRLEQSDPEEIADHLVTLRIQILHHDKAIAELNANRFTTQDNEATQRVDDDSIPA